MNPSKINLNSRDEGLLYFLWKWKVCTTAGITRALFSDVAPKSGYMRLWYLHQAGFIEPQTDRSAHCHLWTLTRKGFERVQRTLPELKEDGYKSENIVHDLVATSMHLGNFLYGVPEGVALFSEQELRRLPFEFYPAWVPRSNLHRPDGYWRVPLGKVTATMALEVELSRKKDLEYENVTQFYVGEPQITRVLWLTRGELSSRTLYTKIVKNLSGSAMIHNFVSFPAYLQVGWSTTIECGPEKGMTVATFLGEKHQTSTRPFCTKFLLDIRKTPYKSDTWRPISLVENRY